MAVWFATWEKRETVSDPRADFCAQAASEILTATLARRARVSFQSHTHLVVVLAVVPKYQVTERYIASPLASVCLLLLPAACLRARGTIPIDNRISDWALLPLPLSSSNPSTSQLRSHTVQTANYNSKKQTNLNAYHGIVINSALSTCNNTRNFLGSNFKLSRY